MRDYTFGRKKAATSTFSHPSLVSPHTPTLANPERGFGLPTNNIVQAQTAESANQQAAQSTDEQSLLSETIQQRSFGHDLSRISFRPQAKLTVGEPGDKYEQEADWMANQVMRMPDPAPPVQPEALSKDDEAVQRKAIAISSVNDGFLQQKCSESEQAAQSTDEQSLLSPAIQQRSFGHELSRISFRPQAKLTVGEPGDKYEQEADWMANQVMRMVVPDKLNAQSQEPVEDSLQRKCAACEQEEDKVQTKPSIQTATDGGLQAGNNNIESRLNSSKGGGSALPDEVRSFMEPRFGADFSQVRVHMGSEAVQMNRDLNAQAFAHKQDIYFGSGKSPANDALTAHELTHVVQQTGGVHFSNVRVHTGSDAVQQAGGTDRLVQRDGAEQDESSAPTEGGAEESGLSDIACELLPDSAVVPLVRAYFFMCYSLASRHLTHYLNGSGAAFEEDVRGLFAANPRALTRVAEQIRAQGGNSGSLVGLTSETAVVRQDDYDSEDWRLSLGNVDQIDFEIGEKQADGRTAVTLSLHDPYQWHPDEDRGDKCLHQAMERQKAKGAKDYMSEGSGVVLMRL